MSFKLTYSTMFNPPPQLHTRFEDAAARVRSKLGATHPLYIQGEDRAGADALEKRNPARRAEILGLFAAAGAADADAAMRAAHAAFPAWRATPAQRRLELLRQVGQIIEERVYEIGAALTLEVGKNRMEALGEAQETADFFYARLIGDRDAVERQTKTFDKVVVDRSESLGRWAHLLQVQAASADGFVYANNHFAGHGPATIAELRELIARRPA